MVFRLFTVKDASYVPAVAIRRVIVQNAAVLRKELSMYSPALSSDLVRTLYRLKRSYRKPMTEIAERLIKDALRGVDLPSVCEVCINEKNNDCDNCYLGGLKNLKQEGGERDEC